MSNKSQSRTWSKNDDYDLYRTKNRKQTLWYEFVSRNDMILPKRDLSNPNFSHTLLSGGVLNVPIEKSKELLMNLSKDIQNGHVPDFNEIAAPITRLYMDLDFKDEVVDNGHVRLYAQKIIKQLDTGNGSEKFPAVTIEEEPLERRRYHNIMVASCIAQKVYEYFPNVTSKDNGQRTENTRSEETFHVHCMWRPSRFKFITEQYKNKAGQFVEETRVVARSFGMHLVWPHLYVTQEQALDIREGVIRALADKFHLKGVPADPCKISPNIRSQAGLNSWQEIVDEKVYLPVASMRMVFSDKYDLCEDCTKRNLQLYGTKKIPMRKSASTANIASSAVANSKKPEEDDADDPLLDYRFYCSCRGSGKKPANSIYAYEATVDAGGFEWTASYQKFFKKNVYQVLISCCICDPNRPDLVRNREFQPTDPVMQLPANAPRYPKFKPSVTASIQANEQQAVEYTKKVTQIVGNFKQYIDPNYTDLPIDSKEFEVVQNLFTLADSVQQDAIWQMSGHKKKRPRKQQCNAQQLQSLLSQNDAMDFARYQGVVVHRLRRGEINGNYYYLVDVADSTTTNSAQYCHNVQRVHTCEKNVYFKITAVEGIVQKCLCWGSKNRTKSCKNYESVGCALTQETRDTLFPAQLIQFGFDKKHRDILIASGYFSGKTAAKNYVVKPSKMVSIDEIKEHALQELVKPFAIVAVDEEDIEELGKRANRKRKHEDCSNEHGCGEDDASARSANKTRDTLCAEKYDAMFESTESDQKNTSPIDTETIEQMTIQEQTHNETGALNPMIQNILNPEQQHELCFICKKTTENCDCAVRETEPMTRKLMIGLWQSYPNAYRPQNPATDCSIFLKSTKKSTAAANTTGAAAETKKKSKDDTSLD